MALSFFTSLRHCITMRRPVLLYAATWTALLTATVAVASFSPEMAFVSAISTSSSFARQCKAEGTVRIPLDAPGEILCLPARMFMRSKIDFIVPPVFAALVVANSAWVVRATGLWVDHEPR
ncbi:uncharacterized protein LOC8269383 [Ricinus communis]|uniref:Uncharacterized protein n=1 Tax=Ricinus communis TaxID=3988 RepID=B9SZC3_RICCO|nr:uncharacterized protein LOC8269383 [Ricinus communis]EEF31049.1 conserved hypothetical protein [Ricinus communis]|eukprot:XP_002531342.1 uncharacterized protein LOC8269383 [Ricinus communis]